MVATNDDLGKTWQFVIPVANNRGDRDEKGGREKISHCFVKGGNLSKKTKRMENPVKTKTGLLLPQQGSMAVTQSKEPLEKDPGEEGRTNTVPPPHPGKTPQGG